MKKVVLSLAVLFAAALVSCGNKPAETEEAPVDSVEMTEEVATVDTVATENVDTTAQAPVENAEAPAETPAETPAK